MTQRGDRAADCDRETQRRRGSSAGPSGEPSQPPTRVMHVINGEDYSGAERVQDLLAQRLPDYGYAVGFACVKPGRFDAARQARETPLARLPMRSSLDPTPALGLARLVRRDNYRLLHTHSPRTALIGRLAAAWAGVPMVHHVHGQTWTDRTAPGANRINRLVERISLIGVAGVIAVRATLRPHLQRRGVPVRLIRIIPNGVPARKVLPESRPPRDDWTLGTAALFRPRKGTEQLVEALALLRERRAPVRLLAVGRFQTPSYESYIKDLVERLSLSETIQFHGFTRDMAAALARMDLFVLPTLTEEGIPMAMLEAMAAGVPVVATRVAGVVDVIRDGIEGALVEPHNPQALAGAVEKIMRGEIDWSSLRTRAQQRQARCFSDSKMAAAVAELYRQILSQKEAGRVGS